MNWPLFWIIILAVLGVVVMICGIADIKKASKQIRESRGSRLEQKRNELDSEILSLKDRKSDLEYEIKLCDEELIPLRQQQKAIRRTEEKINAACGKGYALCRLMSAMGVQNAEEIRSKLYSLSERML